MTIRAITLMAVLLASESAQAAICAFDEPTGILKIQSQGTFSTLQVAGGVLQLDGVPCGATTTSTTSRVVVTGVDDDTDAITFVGRFAPGRNDVPESDTPEIEIEVVGFNDRRDWVVVVGSRNDDVWRFTSGGINLNGDLDEDITLGPHGRVGLRPGKGDDTVDASLYTGLCRIQVVGGDGNDVITGSSGDDTLRGEAGNDVIDGRAGSDVIFDGPGADRVMGGAGGDIVFAEGAADPRDNFHGGGGYDTIFYTARTNGLVITIDNRADDGEPGENDNVHLDVERVDGGSGDDVLVGSSGDNALVGSIGNDELYGGDGDDLLLGDPGNDLLVGDAGDDRLEGREGDDIIDGGAGIDVMFGDLGDDTFYNADGFADTVDCGDGIDDPEPDPLDSFIGCESI